jgi:arylsulfatase A-like enzyme
VTNVGGLRRHVVGALAVALAAVLAAAVVAGWRAAAPEGWWADGFHRLVVDAIRDRFDAWVPAAAVAAMAVGLGLWLLRARALGSRLGVAVLLCILGLRAGVALDAWHASHGPNLVLISIDTLRADRLGTYGYGLPTSPTLDHQLAAEGVTFDEVVSQSPKTTPSHMTMLTSLYPCVHGVHLWWRDAPAHVLSPAVHTLAEVLKDDGYATVAFTGGGQVDKSRGFGQGFDRYSHGDELAKTIHWLDRHHRRKFFLFFHTYAVHDPYVHPLEYVRLFDQDYRGRVLDAVEHLLADEARLTGPERFSEERHKIFWDAVDRDNPADVGFVSRLYDAGIRRMDETMLRPLLERLDKLGVARDTLVVFTSDHGEAFGEHTLFGHDDLHSETVHVPLVLRFPGRLPSGARVAGRARLLDVMPTILDLLHVRAPANVQGESLVPRIGAAAPAGDRDAVSEYDLPWKGDVYESVRRGNLSYAVHGTTERLFDVGTDPGEQHDVAAGRDEDVRALRAVLARWRGECKELAPRLGPDDTDVAPSPERVRQLKALGYLE